VEQCLSKSQLLFGTQRAVPVAEEHSDLASLAVSIGLAERRRGTVFPDRFHQELITTPSQARHALSYVLNNWRKHREDRGAKTRTWNVDPFSTGVLFDGWKENADDPLMWKWRDTYDPLVVYRPKSWLLRVGWRGRGLIGFGEVPGPRNR
jgi:hypothetical protein